MLVECQWFLAQWEHSCYAGVTLKLRFLTAENNLTTVWVKQTRACCNRSSTSPAHWASVARSYTRKAEIRLLTEVNEICTLKESLKQNESQMVQEIHMHLSTYTFQCLFKFFQSNNVHAWSSTESCYDAPVEFILTPFMHSFDFCWAQWAVK